MRFIRRLAARRRLADAAHRLEQHYRYMARAAKTEAELIDDRNLAHRELFDLDHDGLLARSSPQVYDTRGRNARR